MYEDAVVQDGLESREQRKESDEGVKLSAAAAPREGNYAADIV